MQLYQGRHVYMVWVGAEQAGQPETLWYQRGTLSTELVGGSQRIVLQWDQPVGFADRGRGEVPFYPTIATLGEEVVAADVAEPMFDRPAIAYSEFDPNSGNTRLLIRRERRDFSSALPLDVRWPIGNLSRASRSVDAFGRQPICAANRGNLSWGSFNSSVAVVDLTSRSASSIITGHTESEIVGSGGQQTDTSAFIQRVSTTRWQVSDLLGLAP